MRTNVINLLIALLFCFNQAGTSNAKIIRHIDRLIGTEMIKVTKIEYSADATTLTFQTTRDCGPKLKIGHGIYIVDDQGVRHHAISTEDIKLDLLYILPKGEKRRFSVSFEPVAESNQALDVIVPNSFAIFGLHDEKNGLVIPEIKCEIDNEELQLCQTSKPDNVEIVGIYHTDGDTNGDVLYFNYVTPLPEPESWVNQYAKVSPDGQFNATFNTYSPSYFGILKGHRLGGTSLGKIYARPGDKIKVDIYEDHITYEVMNGRKTFNRLTDPRYFYQNPISKFGMEYSKIKDESDYDECYDDIRKAYEQQMEFVNYFCWHNNMTAHECQIYKDNICMEYIGAYIGLDQYIYERMDSNAEYANIAAKMEHEYLNGINPDNDNLCAYNKGLWDVMGQLYHIRACEDSVSLDNENRWMQIIELQKQELKRRYGWKEDSFATQSVIAATAFRINSQKLETGDTFKKVKAQLHNEFLKTKIDIIQKELSNKQLLTNNH